MITTQRELRRVFWLNFQHTPGISKKKIPDYSGAGTMYNTNTRCAFVDWVDAMYRNSRISARLASSAKAIGLR